MMTSILLFTGAACALCLAGCAMPHGSASGQVSKKAFGTADGQPVELYTLRNSKGAEADIMTYGGIVEKLVMPDRNGNMADIVLGFDSLDGYTSDAYLK